MIDVVIDDLFSGSVWGLVHKPSFHAVKPTVYINRIGVGRPLGQVNEALFI